MSADRRRSRRRPQRSGTLSADRLAEAEGCELRRVQPYEAVKHYLCPGCGNDIAPGTGHVVVMPIGAADLRRHWHWGCWDRRQHRRPVS